MINRQIEANQNNPNFILNVDILKNFEINKVKTGNEYEIYDNVNNIPWGYECKCSNKTQFKIDMFVLILKIKKKNNRNLNDISTLNIWRKYNHNPKIFTRFNRISESS